MWSWLTALEKQKNIHLVEHYQAFSDRRRLTDVTLFGLTPICVYPRCLILANRMASFLPSIYNPEPKDRMWSCLSNLKLTEKFTQVKGSAAVGAFCFIMYVKAVSQGVRIDGIFMFADVKLRNVILSRNASHTIQSPLSDLNFPLMLLWSQWKNKLSARLLLPCRYSKNTCHYRSSVALTPQRLSDG